MQRVQTARHAQVKQRRSPGASGNSVAGDSRPCLSFHTAGFFAPRFAPARGPSRSTVQVGRSSAPYQRPTPLSCLSAHRPAVSMPSSVINSRRLIIRSPRRRARGASAARRLGFIWIISVESAERPATLESADWDHLGCSGAAQCGGTVPKQSRRSSYTPRANRSRDAPARSWCRIDWPP